MGWTYPGPGEPPRGIGGIEYNGKWIAARDDLGDGTVMYQISDGSAVAVDVDTDSFIVTTHSPACHTASLNWSDFQGEPDEKLLLAVMEDNPDGSETREDTQNDLYDAAYLVLCLDGEGR